MTLMVVGTADAERFLTVMRDAPFGWTAAEVPELLRVLDWVVTAELPGRMAAAQTPWGLSPGTATIKYGKDGTVTSIVAHATGRTAEEPVDRVAVADAFAGMVAVATQVLGKPTSVSPSGPEARWRRAAATLSIRTAEHLVLIDWSRNDYVDLLDSVGDR